MEVAYLVEDARFERNRVELFAQCAESASIDRMSMSCTKHVRPGGMEGPVDEERSFVQDFDLSVVENVSLMIHPKQIALDDAIEVYAERIDLYIV